MNIVNYWKDKVEQWNTDQRCGFCYSFSAPTIESSINKVQREDCCVNVFLVNDYTESARNEFQSGLYVNLECRHGFTLYLLAEIGDLGTNIDNEQKDYDTEESIRERIIDPLKECFGCEGYGCTDIPNYLGVISWRVDNVIKWGDMNYSGIKITAKIATSNE